MATNQFTWDIKTPPGGFTDRLRDIAYTSNATLGKYCAVGDGPSIITSSDGDTWVEQTHGYTGSYFLGVATNDSIWVAVGGDGSTGTPGAIYTSADGVTWVDRTPATNMIYFFKVHWDGTNFIAGSGNAAAGAWTSPDGITWTARTLPGIASTSLAYRFADNGSGRVVCGANNGKLWYSDDSGASWTAATSPLEDDFTISSLRNVIWNGSYFLAARNNVIYNIDFAAGEATPMIVSADGINWVYEPAFPNSSIRPPQFYEMGVDGSGTILAVGYGGPAFTGTGSSGSITWTELPRLAVGLTLWPRGSVHDGTSWFVVGDSAFIAEGATASVNIPTSPSPATVEFATIGTNIVSTSAQLTWTGIGSGTHQVYFGTDPDSLVDQGNVGSAETFNPTLAANTSYWWRIDIIDGGTTIGDVWHFVTEPTSSPQATDQITAFGDTAYLTSTYSPGGTYETINSVANSSLIHGHRYFIMTQTKYTCDNGTGLMAMHMGDREILSTRGIVNTIFQRADRFHTAGVYNHLAGEAINYKARTAASTFSISHNHFLCLDLDSPGMEEDKDWFSNHDWINQDLTTSYADYLELTFTPDGYSDYMVVANTNWNKYNTSTSYDHLARLYDATTGEVLAKVGGEIDDSTRSYHQGWGMQWVLRAPANTSKTIKIQAKVENTAAMRLYGVDLFVLRLNRFKNVAINQVRETISPGPLVNYTAPSGLSWNQAQEAFSRLDYIPGSNGETIVMFGAETRANTTATGTSFIIRQGGIDSGDIIYLTPGYPPGGQMSKSDYYATHNVDVDAHVTHINSRLLTGQSGQSPMNVFGASKHAEDTTTMHSLTMFGTEYETAPSVFKFSPLDKSKLNPPNVPITFEIRGIDGVDRDTINISMHVSDGWKEYPTGLTSSSIDAIAYDGSGVFVAVGTNGGISRSVDGYKWEPQTSGTSSHFLDVTYGAGLFVAVGYDEVIFNSTDGMTWVDVSPGVTNRLTAIVYGGGQFVVSGYNTSAWTSPDGTNWTARTPVMPWPYAVDYNGTDLYVMVGGAGDINSSPDGIDWTDRATTITTQQTWDVAWGDGRWMVPILYTPELLTSTDGINWSWLDIGAPKNADLRKVRYGGGRWVVTGFNGFVTTTAGDPTDPSSWKVTAVRGNVSHQELLFANDGWYLGNTNGSIMTSPNAGYNSADRPVMVDGQFSTGFASESTVDELDGYDGYTIAIYPEYGVLGKNQLVNISLDADNHVGTSMTTHETWFHTTQRKIFSMYKTANMSGSQSTGILFMFNKDDGIIPGHRYLVLQSGTVNSLGSRAINQFLNVDGSLFLNQIIMVYGRDYDVHGAAFVLTPQESISIVLTSYQGSTEDDRMLLIDLDSDPGMFAENSDWFYDTDDTITGNLNDTWTDNEYGSVTFTPDGQSNYLVIANSICKWSDGHDPLEVRVYDSVDGELCKTGSEDEGSTRESPGNTMTRVMVAPSAVSRTLTVQHKGSDDWNHYHSMIIVIKMDAFLSHAHSQTLSTRTSFGGSQQTIETAEFTQDGYGEMLAIAHMEYNDGMNINIHYPSGTNIYYNPFVADADGTEVDEDHPTSHHSNLFGAVRRTNLSVGQKQSALLRMSAASTGDDLYRSNIVLLGTELYMPPPDVVTTPDPTDTEIDVDLDKVLSWTGGANTTSYNVYYGTDADPSGNFIGNQLAASYDPPGFLDLAETYYWRVDAVGGGGTTTGPVWSFTTVLTLPPPEKATDPDPAHDTTGVSVDKIIGWTEGTSIVSPTHDVYFGTDVDPSGNFQGNQLSEETTFDPGFLNTKTLKLDALTEYWWRIDEVNVGGTTIGDVWHFTTESVTLPTKATVLSPTNGESGVIPDEVISWAAGTGALSHDVYFGTDVDPSGNYVGNQTGTSYDPPGNMTVNETYYWRIDEVNAGGITTGDVWSFTTLTSLPLPTKATNPTPHDTEVNVSPIISLDWNTGTGIPYIGTITHDVYLGTDPDPSANFIINTGVSGYSPGLLNYSETYYWRIDEVSAVSGTRTGDVWSFATAPILIISPRDGDKIYDVINVVGNTAPSVTVHAEVHSDRLIADAFTTTDENGDFTMAISFGNEVYGTSIRLVLVTIASPESEEVVVELIQGRKPLGPLLLRSGRRVNVDENTLALWRLGRSVLHGSGAGSLLFSHNFTTASETTPPTGWTRSGTSGWQPTFNNEMRVHSVSSPSTSSYIVRFNDSGVVAKFTPGFRIRFNWKTTEGIPLSPDDTAQALMYNIYNGHRFSLRMNSSGALYITNAAGAVIVTLPEVWDRYSWSTIDVVGVQTVSGDNQTWRVEVYVDGMFAANGYAETTTGTGHYIGNPFAAPTPSFSSSDFDDYSIREGDPFLALPGTNLQGDSTRDLPVRAGVYTQKTENNTVPFDYCGLFSSSSYLSSDNAAFDLVGAFTVEGWIKADTDSLGSVERVIFGKQAPDTSGWVLRISATSVLEAVTYNGTEQVMFGETISENEWHHIAFAWDGARAYVYIDGEIIRSAAQGYTANSANDFVIGAYSDGTSRFDGDIADIRYSNIARGSWEIYNTYYALSDPQEGLVGNNGTIVVMDLIDNPGLVQSYTDFGTIVFRASPVGVKARDFDGSTMYTTLDDNGAWDHFDLSVDLWFSADSLQDVTLISRLAAASNAGWSIELNLDGTISVTVTDTGSNSVTVSNGVYSATSWHHVAVTFDYSEAELSVYVDGRLAGSEIMSSTTGSFASALPIDIARQAESPFRYFDGAIAFVKIGDEVMTSKTIFDYFNGTSIKEGR